jgi:hypothetical protein
MLIILEYFSLLYSAWHPETGESYFHCSLLNTWVDPDRPLWVFVLNQGQETLDAILEAKASSGLSQQDALENVTSHEWAQIRYFFSVDLFDLYLICLFTVFRYIKCWPENFNTLAERDFRSACTT